MDLGSFVSLLGVDKPHSSIMEGGAVRLHRSFTEGRMVMKFLGDGGGVRSRRPRKNS